MDKREQSVPPKGIKIVGISAKSACAGRVSVGDRLIAIDGHAIMDVLDYMHYATAQNPLLTLGTSAGVVDLRIRKPAYDDLGLDFESFLMDAQRSCANNCVFCFVDQLPPGMRETLYFKDDDARLSFLMGNYISMTNLPERDIQRMIDYHISPINISIHSTDPALRSLLLGNPRGGSSLETLHRFAQAGLSLNCQIVLCAGLNDGQQLSKTLDDLLALSPAVDSVAVVPAGLTAHRQGLYPLQPLTQAQAADACARIFAAGERAIALEGRRIVYPSDELLQQAGLPIPEVEFYEEFPQLENGVGMLALLEEEFYQALPHLTPPPKPRAVSAVTGQAAHPLLQKLFDVTLKKCNNLTGNLTAVRNDFFGSTITVAGLVTGRDILRQLEGQPLGETLLVPAAMLRYDRACFLDDVTVAELEQTLGLPVTIVENSGEALLEALTGQPLSGQI